MPKRQPGPYPGTVMATPDDLIAAGLPGGDPYRPLTPFQTPLRDRMMLPGHDRHIVVVDWTELPPDTVFTGLISVLDSGQCGACRMDLLTRLAADLHTRLTGLHLRPRHTV